MVNQLKAADFAGVLDKASSPLIVVYTMGKVGSTTVSQSLHYDGIPCLDVHFLNPVGLRRQLEIEMGRGGVLPGNLGESIIHNFILARQPKRRVLYITLVREPVSRNFSAVFQSLVRGEENTIDSVVEKINNYPTGIPDHWFQQELFRTTGLEFPLIQIEPGDMHSVVHRDKFSLLVVKLGVGDSVLSDIVSDFIGTRVAIQRHNEAASKWYSSLYEEILSKRLYDPKFITGSLENEYVQWFWTPEERQKFRAKHAG